MLNTNVSVAEPRVAKRVSVAPGVTMMTPMPVRVYVLKYGVYTCITGVHRCKYSNAGV